MQQTYTQKQSYTSDLELIKNIVEAHKNVEGKQR